MIVNHINHQYKKPLSYNPTLIRDLGEKIAQRTVKIMGNGGYQIPANKKH